jgi:hypothetical protein
MFVALSTVLPAVNLIGQVVGFLPFFFCAPVPDFFQMSELFCAVERKLRRVLRKLRGRQEKFPPARRSVSLRRVKSRPPVGINPTKARAFAEQVLFFLLCIIARLIEIAADVYQFQKRMIDYFFSVFLPHAAKPDDAYF